jgi:5-methylcytosine-specific restriction endonuclease McrA
MGRAGVCGDCGETFEVPGARGCIPRWCPPCKVEVQREAVRAWRKANPEKYAAQRARWNPEASEVVAERHRLWHAANAERIAKVRRRRYLERQQATNNQVAAEWRRRNPGKNAEILNRRRARLLGQFVAPVDPKEIRERDGGICQLCGEPIDDPKQRSIDHIVPLALGGTHEPANVQLAHRTCNSRKGPRLEMPA